MDITAHAEIVALRTACIVAHAIHLPGAIVASTCEPCPMCMAALHWARVSSVYYGATIADAQRAGFNELQLPAADLLRLGKSQVQLVAGVREDECRGDVPGMAGAGGKPQLLIGRGLFVADGDAGGNAAPRAEGGDKLQTPRLEHGDQVVEDPIGYVLIENALVAILLQVELEALEFHTSLVREHR